MKLRRLLPLLAVLPVLAGCGGTDLEVASDDPLYEGAQIFNERCGGCHTYDAAATEGSSGSADDSEYKDGPNFNQRKEQYSDVLYAIQNGGYSSGPMPQNIVLGEDAKVVACFVATFSGQEADQEPSPGGITETPKTQDCRNELPTR
ncbi:MAG: cytochrome c [Solirubrobacteraceae bacterium]